MKQKRFVLSLVLVFPLVARAEFPTTRPYKSVIYHYQEITEPVPQKVYAALVDLSDPQVRVRVAPGGPDPDGPGEWQTTLMPPTGIAEREGFDLVINGDFYAVKREPGPDGKEQAVRYEGGIVAKVSGPAVTDGKKWAPAGEQRAAFLIGPNKRPAIAQLKDPPSNAQQVVAGSHVIVQNGKNVAPDGPPKSFARGPHPRTAVGIRDGGNTLVLVVIDGRKKDAIGMSLQETAEVMLKLGCTEAANLDGGGSSVLAIRDPKTRQMQIVNVPSDGRERAVANVLGVTVTPKK